MAQARLGRIALVLLGFGAIAGAVCFGGLGWIFLTIAKNVVLPLMILGWLSVAAAVASIAGAVMFFVAARGLAEAHD